MAYNDYSVPLGATDLLELGLINNPLHSSAPADIKEAAKNIEFVGSKSPVIPINWRFAESISAIKGFQGSMLNVLIQRKYGVKYQRIVINTDHAQLFFMSPLLMVVDPNCQAISIMNKDIFKYFPDVDKHGVTSTPEAVACTNIYRTKDDRFFHIHASLDPRPTQDALGLAHRLDTQSIHQACNIFEAKISTYDSVLLDSLINDEYRQAGTVCHSTEEYLASPHGQANAHVGLYSVNYIHNPAQIPTWWMSVEGHTNVSRPLFGLKIIDLTRIIAAPTIGRELAELGASVLRITSPNVPDVSLFNIDVGWGKWNSSLDLTQKRDRATLKALILESDVVIDGYRPGVMDKWGFGKDEILEMFQGREKGVILARENCFGWNGPWSSRSGWQQISDANTGVSLEFGRAMGLEEPVTPVFPNSDYCTGASGATGVLQAIIERAEKGGSYVVDIALNYYSQWLINSCSTYPPEVWNSVWSKNGRPVFRYSDPMQIMLPAVVELLKKNGKVLFNPDFLEDRENKAIGVAIRTVKPILTFPDGLVRPGYNIGTRRNGLDQSRWPENLLTEVIE